MILAAGRGERMRPLTDRKPKALLEIGGVSLIERQLHRLQDAGVNVAVINLGGGIQRALPLLGDDPFWVMNADVFTDMKLPPPNLPADCLAHLFLVPTPPYKVAGDFDLRNGRVCRSAEPRYTFSGIGLYRPALFDGCKAGRFPLAPLLMSAADRGELSGEIYSGVWEDVGTRERLRRLNDPVAGADA
jgi:MurNAc alpha-1-phosphate uridylyltransferase